MTTVPNLPALPATKDITGADIPIPLTGDADYRASIYRARGNNLLDVRDYGAVGDGTTDDRAAIQAAIDAAEADGAKYTLYFPRGIYRVVPVAGIGLNSTISIRGAGEGAHSTAVLAGSASVLYLDSTTAGDVLWEFTNAGDSTTHNVAQYNASWRDLTFRSKNPGTANQHCFQFGNAVGTVDAHQWTFHDVHFRDFSGLCFHFQNVTGVVTAFGFSSSAWTGKLILDNIGGLIGYSGTGVGDEVIGTGMYFQNIHVTNGGWNDTSPWDYQFDFKAFREIIIDNIVIEGGGLSVTKSGLIRFDGEGWNYIRGLHYEQGGTAPTYSIDLDNDINPNGTRHTEVKGSWGLFDKGMKIAISDVCKLVLDGVRGNQDAGNNLSSDLIDDTSFNGSWSVEFKNYVISITGGLSVIPQHVGRVKLRGIGSAQQAIHHEDAEMPLVEYAANRDGWLCGLPSQITNANRLGSQYAQFYIQSLTGPTYEEIGMVNDSTEGRVFAVRSDGTARPVFTADFTLPADYLQDANDFGAQVGLAVRWRYIHQEGASFNYRWDGTSTASWENEAGYNVSVSDVDKDTWYSTVLTAITEGAGPTTFRANGADTPTVKTEFRISHVKLSLGGMLPRNYGGGALVDATANRMRPLRWYGELPTWGDYIDGDRVDDIAPAVGNPQGWVCTTAGALASAWQATTAYAIGDWVENDSGKIYICDQAGTSAGSGGPTGTGADIVDNTARWDYHDSQAVFTALANV